MREIKYRAWQRLFKEMIPVFSIDFENQMINTSGPWRFFNEVELMQYTGLKDKNGVEIYEGDVIGGATLESYATVNFGNHMTSTDYYASSAYGWHLKDSRGETFALHQYYEVIGNIYENPELLEGDTK